MPRKSKYQEGFDVGYAQAIADTQKRAAAMAGEMQVKRANTSQNAIEAATKLASVLGQTVEALARTVDAADSYRRS